MKFKNFLNEKLIGKQKNDISFIDIDETVFKTFAKVLVINKITKKVVRKLDNQEFNSYTLKPNEVYNFEQFKDAKLFRKTSIPIPKTINRIKKMLKNIKSKNSNSKIIFLTARSDFDNKKEFLQTFKDYGIDMDTNNVYVERAGNKKGVIPELKEKIMLKYILTGKYFNIRLIDDFKPNVEALIKIKLQYNDQINNAIKKYYNLTDKNFAGAQYFPLLVKQDGTLTLIK